MKYLIAILLASNVVMACPDISGKWTCSIPFTDKDIKMRVLEKNINDGKVYTFLMAGFIPTERIIADNQERLFQTENVNMKFQGTKKSKCVGEKVTTQTALKIFNKKTNVKIIEVKFKDELIKNGDNSLTRSVSFNKARGTEIEQVQLSCSR